MRKIATQNGVKHPDFTRNDSCLTLDAFDLEQQEFQACKLNDRGKINYSCILTTDKNLTKGYLYE
jgi:hypothetical protein